MEIYLANGEQVTLDGGPFFLWDSCQAAQHANIVDLSGMSSASPRTRVDVNIENLSSRLADRAGERNPQLGPALMAVNKQSGNPGSCANAAGLKVVVKNKQVWPCSSMAGWQPVQPSSAPSAAASGAAAPAASAPAAAGANGAGSSGGGAAGAAAGGAAGAAGAASGGSCPGNGVYQCSGQTLQICGYSSSGQLGTLVSQTLGKGDARSI